MTKRLLREADRLYRRSEAGIAKLPRAARPGIWAARLIYDAIGGRLRRMDYDSITARARTGRATKLGLIGVASARATAASVLPQSALILAPPLDETAYLVEAASGGARPVTRSASVLSVLADLSARDAGHGNPRPSA